MATIEIKSFTIRGQDYAEHFGGESESEARPCIIPPLEKEWDDPKYSENKYETNAQKYTYVTVNVSGISTEHTIMLKFSGVDQNNNNITGWNSYYYKISTNGDKKVYVKFWTCDENPYWFRTKINSGSESPTSLVSGVKFTTITAYLFSGTVKPQKNTEPSWSSAKAKGSLNLNGGLWINDGCKFDEEFPNVTVNDNNHYALNLQAKNLDYNRGEWGTKTYPESSNNSCDGGLLDGTEVVVRSHRHIGKFFDVYDYKYKRRAKITVDSYEDNTSDGTYAVSVPIGEEFSYKDSEGNPQEVKFPTDPGTKFLMQASDGETGNSDQAWWFIPYIYVCDGSYWYPGTPYVFKGTKWVPALEVYVFDGEKWCKQAALT